MNIRGLIDALIDPGPLERPMPTWFWNGRIDHKSLERQLDLMLDKRVRAFFIQPMPQEFRPNEFVHGLDVEYLGSEYLAAVAHVVRAAADREMKVWLHDEGGWPSGPNLGRVVEERSDLKGKVARYNEAGEVEILERGYPVDLLDRETAETFIRQVHERYLSAVGDHFGTTVAGFFTSGPRYAGRVGGAEIPWTPKLPAEFKARNGYDLSLGLAILFGLKASRSLPEDKRAQVTCDFYDVVTSLWRENYFTVIRDWCCAHNLLFTGHLNADDSLLGHFTNGGDFFRAVATFDWPGIDVPASRIGVETDRSETTDFPKFASSAAHVAGCNRVLSKSFAGSGWDLTPAQMRWMTNFQYIRGVNAVSPMAFYSDVSEARKVGTVSDQFQTNPLFAHYGPYADYAGRLGVLASAGAPVVRVGLYYPIRSLWTGGGVEIQKHLQSIGRSLLEHQIDFDYLSDDAIAAAQIANGVLHAGHGAYEALIFPSATTVSIETMRAAHSLAEEGGIVAFLGAVPHLACKAANISELNQILESLRSTAVFADESADQDVVFGTLPRTIRLAIGNPDIRASHRTAGNVELYLLANESRDRAHQLSIRVPASENAFVYDPDTAAIARVERTGNAVRVDIGPSEFRALLLSNDEIEAASDSVDERGEPDTTVALDGSWSARIVEQWTYEDGELIHSVAGGEETAQTPRTGEAESLLTSWSELFSADVCGTVEYSTRFTVTDDCRHAVLDLGDVGVAASVEANGIAVGTRIWPPYRLDLRDTLQLGVNQVRIRVTSTLHRLMSSPRVQEDLKSRGWYNSYAQDVVKRSREPAPAGLFGPVRLYLWR